MVSIAVTINLIKFTKVNSFHLRYVKHQSRRKVRESKRGASDDNFHYKNIMEAQHKTTNTSKKHNFTSPEMKFLNSRNPFT